MPIKHKFSVSIFNIWNIFFFFFFPSFFFWWETRKVAWAYIENKQLMNIKTHQGDNVSRHYIRPNLATNQILSFFSQRIRHSITTTRNMNKLNKQKRRQRCIILSNRVDNCRRITFEDNSAKTKISSELNRSTTR